MTEPTADTGARGKKADELASPGQLGRWLARHRLLDADHNNLTSRRDGCSARTSGAANHRHGTP